MAGQAGVRPKCARILTVTQRGGRFRNAGRRARDTAPPSMHVLLPHGRQRSLTANHPRRPINHRLWSAHGLPRRAWSLLRTSAMHAFSCIPGSSAHMPWFAGRLKRCYEKFRFCFNPPCRLVGKCTMPLASPSRPSSSTEDLIFCFLSPASSCCIGCSVLRKTRRNIFALNPAYYPVPPS